MSHTNNLLFDAILINKIIAETKFKNLLKKIYQLINTPSKNITPKNIKKFFQLNINF